MKTIKRGETLNVYEFHLPSGIVHIKSADILSALWRLTRMVAIEDDDMEDEDIEDAYLRIFITTRVEKVLIYVPINLAEAALSDEYRAARVLRELCYSLTRDEFIDMAIAYSKEQDIKNIFDLPPDYKPSATVSVVPKVKADTEEYKDGYLIVKAMDEEYNIEDHPDEAPVHELYRVPMSGVGYRALDEAFTDLSALLKEAFNYKQYIVAKISVNYFKFLKGALHISVPNTDNSPCGYYYKLREGLMYVFERVDGNSETTGYTLLVPKDSIGMLLYNDVLQHEDFVYEGLHSLLEHSHDSQDILGDLFEVVGEIIYG